MSLSRKQLLLAAGGLGYCVGMLVVGIAVGDFVAGVTTSIHGLAVAWGVGATAYMYAEPAGTRFGALLDELLARGGDRDRELEAGGESA